MSDRTLGFNITPDKTFNLYEELKRAHEAGMAEGAAQLTAALARVERYEKALREIEQELHMPVGGALNKAYDIARRAITPEKVEETR